ncbi:MAG: hypothetical protein FWD97_00995 [Defluviitaleaceae bacterium]|nr:hypothetical protein [Defluviitaleaceae bacterium]
MRNRMPDFFNYTAGAVLLVLAAVLIVGSGVNPGNLANRVHHETFDRSYRNFYQSDIRLHRNPLRQTAVYLPMYSVTEESDLQRFLTSFEMEHAEIFEYEDYFLAKCGHRLLRAFRFLDLIEYEGVSNPIGGEIYERKARSIAEDFARQRLFLQLPFDVETKQHEGGFTVTFIENLGKIPNRAFPTVVEVDNYGNITHVSHFYFEYEELGRGDLITPHAAMTLLPQNHEGKIRIKKYELAFVFADSILQPVYIFNGTYPDGSPFQAQVSAVHFN